MTFIKRRKNSGSVGLGVLFALLMVFNEPCDAAGKTWYEGAHAEGPSLIIETGGYSVRFSEKPSWTLREAFFNGKRMLAPSGWMQPVVNEANVPKGTDPFLGTGHRSEQVGQVALLADGASNALAPGLSVVGNEFIFVKNSRFVSGAGLIYEHRSQISVGVGGIGERYWFRAGAATSNVNYMYVFMHIFTNTTKEWIVGDDDGKEVSRGEFGDDNSFSLRKDLRWALVYDPVVRLGITYVYPQLYLGKPGFKNSFWNRPYDNKLYLQIDPKRSLGEEFEYTVSLAAFDADADWEKRGMEMIAARLAQAPKKNDTPSKAELSIRFDFDSPTGLDLKTGEKVVAESFRGNGALKILGDGKFKYKKIPIVLKPLTAYRISAAIRKGTKASPKSTDAMISVVNYTKDGRLEIFATIGASVPCDGAWHTVDAAFITSGELTERLGLAMYNSSSTDTVRFDEILVEETQAGKR